MQNQSNEPQGIASLGVVFFANEIIRALDAFRESKKRPEELSNLCDKAIVSLHVLQRPDTGTASPSVGLMTTAEEIATLATSVQRVFHPTTEDEATKAVERVQKSLGRIKEQKVFSSDLRERIDDLVKFFESVAEEGLANCRRRVAGESTEAERIWQHFSTI